MNELTIAPLTEWSVSGDTVVVADRIGRIFTLNVVGSRIWTMLASGASPEILTNELSAQYQLLNVKQLRRDIDAFLLELKERGMIVSSGEG